MYECSLNAATKAYALEHLGESEDVAKDAVLKIYQFLKENPEINARSDQQTILGFLRASKFNVEQTEKRIRK
jgi:hypothetical protein